MGTPTSRSRRRSYFLYLGSTVYTSQSLRRLLSHISDAWPGPGHVTQSHNLDARRKVIDLGLDMLKGVPPTLLPPKKITVFCYICLCLAVAIVELLDQPCVGLFLRVIYGY